jgi:CheY-like chemotaxis protein
LLRHRDIGLVDGILTKPVTSSCLYNALAQAQARRRQGAQGDGAQERPASVRLAGVRVLVTDDSDSNREVASRILSAEGATVSVACDGREAVDWLLRHPHAVDIVLMDVQMPVLDGYGATRLLRQSPLFDDLPIVALTAGAFKSQQDEARAAGMDAFVAKPFNVDELMEVVRRLARGGPARAAEDAEDAASLPSPLPLMAPFAGIDIERARLVWSEWESYSAVLGRFAADYGDVADRLDAELAARGTAGMDALCHQLKGVAGNLALPEISRLAGELQKAAAHGGDAAGLIAQLRGALATALESIAALASQVERSGAAGQAAPAAVQVATEDGPPSPPVAEELLAALLECLDQDNPDVAAPLLSALAPLLPAEAVSAVRSRLDDFDFRGAEAEVRALILLAPGGAGDAR